MKDEIQYIKTSTSGNVSLFLYGKNSYIDKDGLIEEVNRMDLMGAEQLGFIENKKNYIKMDMAGGEMCGGAILASSLIQDSNEVLIKSRGIDFKVELYDNDSSKVAKSSFPHWGCKKSGA